MYINKSGQYGGRGGTDSMAKEFTDGFSILYEKTAAERPIYLELENLFRFVALAKISEKKCGNQLDIDYLLEQFPLSKTLVEQTLPGRSAVKDFSHRQDFQAGYQITQLWLPSCGGVSIEIQPQAYHFIRNRTRQTNILKEKISNKKGANIQLGK